MAEVDEGYNDNGLEFEVDQSEEADAFAQNLAPDQRQIRTKSVDPEVKSLHDKWKRGRLILQPDFQRQYVWDRKKASKLIESALLSVPLPIIYLAEEADSRESVIDGQQRLTSFFSFIDGHFPDKESFRLTGLKIFPELNRKSFSELDERTQDRIRDYQVRAITICKDSDSELKFEIFERLNTGSVPLNDMELRNCIYRGPYITLLKELANYPEFQSLVGLKTSDRRMRDVELVLRFASFYHATYLKYKPPMRRFFNQDMEAYQNISEKDAEELRSAFKNAIQIVKSLLGQYAFKRFYAGQEANQNGSWEEKKFNASLYDVMMGTLSNIPKNTAYQALDAIREAFLFLMTSNQEFIDAILLSTSSQEKVKQRFDIARKTIEEIIGRQSDQPRCFSLKLKRELFSQNPTCALCKQSIQQIDDAALDHIEQYWRGGKTIPDNARLTHRYCNQARARTE